MIVVGDKLDENGVTNLGYLNKKKLEIVLSKTKIFVSSGENIYSFFAIDCINNNVKILSSHKPIKIGKKFDKHIIYFNTEKDLKKREITKLLKKF